MRLKDQVAVVTGAGSGIGQATAVRFAEEGAKVVVVDIDRAGGEETVSLIKKNSGEGLTVHADVSKENEAKQIGGQAKDAFGKIDILVNNAAVFIFKGIEASVEEWQRSLSVNILGTALCTKYAVEKMKEQNKGAIVNLGSISAMTAQPEFTAYSATKAALTAFSESMQVDLAVAGLPVKVHVVNPGVIDTELFELPDNDPLVASEVERLPVKSMVQPVLDMLDAGTFEIYVPDWFPSVVSRKFADPDAFLAGTVQYASSKEPA